MLVNEMSKKIILNTLQGQGICWVPNCNQKQHSVEKKYLPLPPPTSIFREIWLALATKAINNFNLDQVFFCEDHFEDTLSQDININNIGFKCGQHNKFTIPNKNMPDKICRICNKFVDNKEYVYVMSNSWKSHIPAGVSAELKNLQIEVNPEPLHRIFTFCINDFVLPTDPLPLVCNKCFYHLWLFFAFKKRAIYVEDFLSQNLTPEKYGQMVLCRTCPDHCSNFFPIGQESEVGEVLQKLFVNDYSPDVVPLRVCLNCYNVLQMITQFRKTFINVEDAIKKRTLLCAKLKASSGFSSATSPTTDSSDRKKKVDKENMILVNLMLQFGQALRSDLHAIDNWKPICLKLQEQGINHKVPNLITNWKKMTNIAQDKLKNKAPLTELEKLVCKFYRSSTYPASPVKNPPLEAHQSAPSQQTYSKLLKDVELAQSTNQCPTYDPSPRKAQHKNRGVIRSRKNCSPSTSTSSPTSIIVEDVESVNNSTMNSTIPLSEKEKLELIEIMVKYKKEKSLQFDMTAHCDMWPDIEKMLRDRGSQRNIEYIKEAWHDMKETTKNALNKKATLSDSQKLLADFLFQPQSSEKISTVRCRGRPPKKNQAGSKRGLKKSNASKLAENLNDSPKTVNKSVQNGNQAVTPDANIERPLTSFEKKLTFAKGLSCEYDKLTSKEINNRSVWKILVTRVMERHMPTESFNKLMSLWGRLKVSANVHEKDGSDPIDLIIWEILQKYKHDKPPSPTKRMSKNVTTPRAAVEDVRKAICQDNTNFEVPPSPVAQLVEPVNDADTAVISEPSTSKRPLEETLSESRSESNIKKVKVNVSEETSDPVIPSTSSVIPPCLQTSSRVYQVLLRAGKDGQIVSDEQLFSLIKCAYKEMRRSREINQGYFWMRIINKLYADGFEGMTKLEAKAAWIRIRQITTVELSKGKLSPFCAEVNRFLNKVKREKMQFVKSTTVPLKKKKSLPHKKKPYEVDTVYRPNRSDINSVSRSEKDNVEDKTPRRSTAPISGLFLMDAEEEEKKDVKQKKGNYVNWTAEEKTDFLDIIGQKLPCIPNQNFWSQVLESYEAKGYRRSPASLRQKWWHMQKRVETKINENAVLNDIEKKVENIIIEMKQLGRTLPSLVNIDETPRTSRPLHDINESPSKSINPVKKEIISPTYSTETIDLTYDYVSLEDLQQSSNWDMPTLHPMINNDEKEKVKFVVSKVEGGVDNEYVQSTSHVGYAELQGEEIEDENSRGSDSQGYVGATDLVGVEDLF